MIVRGAMTITIPALRQTIHTSAKPQVSRLAPANTCRAHLSECCGIYFPLPPQTRGIGNLHNSGPSVRRSWSPLVTRTLRTPPSVRVSLLEVHYNNPSVHPYARAPYVRTFGDPFCLFVIQATPFRAPALRATEAAHLLTCVIVWFYSSLWRTYHNHRL